MYMVVTGVRFRCRGQLVISSKTVQATQLTLLLWQDVRRKMNIVIRWFWNWLHLLPYAFLCTIVI